MTTMLICLGTVLNLVFVLFQASLFCYVAYYVLQLRGFKTCF